MCYTYDNLSRVTARTVKKLSNNSVISTETFNYDASGNITDTFAYDTNGFTIGLNTFLLAVAVVTAYGFVTTGNTSGFEQITEILRRT